MEHPAVTVITELLAACKGDLRPLTTPIWTSNENEYRHFDRFLARFRITEFFFSEALLHNALDDFYRYAM